MPEGPNRRTFLKQSAVAASALAAGCAPDGERAAEARALPTETLRAVGETVLPSELGPDGFGRVVSSFERWLGEYAPVAEQIHGYGSQEIRYGPPHPGPRWTAQLDALELEAHARHQGAFGALDLAMRRDLIERALDPPSPGALASQPGALEAEHVVVGLLAYFYGSPEATNLCYQRRIDASSCRPLETSGDEPPRIEERIATAPRPGSDRAPPARSHPDRFERGLEPAS